MRDNRSVDDIDLSQFMEILPTTDSKKSYKFGNIKRILTPAQKQFEEHRYCF